MFAVLDIENNGDYHYFYVIATHLCSRLLLGLHWQHVFSTGAYCYKSSIKCF